MKAEELVVEVKIDDSSLKKGYENLDKSNDKMEQSLENIEKKAEQTADKLFSLGKKVAGFIGAAIIANKTISQAIAEAKEITRLDDFSNSVSSSIEDVNALNNAVTSLGGDKSVAESNINAIFNSMTATIRNANSEAGKAFKGLGVEVKDSNGNMRDLFETMGDLSQSISQMDENKAKLFMRSIGVTDRATLELMMKGREEFNQMIIAQKASSPVNAESARKSVEYTKALGELSVEFNKIKSSISVVVIPILTFFTQKISGMVKLMNENKPFVVGFFGAIATVLTALYLPAVIKAAVATWALIAPVLAAAAPFIALAAVIGLVVSEWYAFLNGHDNLISRLLDANPTLKKWSDNFSMYLNDAIDFTKNDWKAAQENFSWYINDGIFGTIDIAKNWSNAFSTHIGDAMDYAVKKFEAFKKAYETYITPVIDNVNTGFLDWIKKDEDEKSDRESVIYMQNGKSYMYGNMPNGVVPIIDTFEPSNQGRDLSFINPKDINDLGGITKNLTDSADSPVIQNNKSFMSSINSNQLANNKMENKTYNVDKIEIKMPDGDPDKLLASIDQAIDKAFGRQLSDVSAQSATGIKA